LRIRILLIIVLGILLTGCGTEVKQTQFPDKGSDAQWRRALSEDTNEDIVSISKNGGIKVFGKNPVKVVSEKDYSVTSNHSYYYVIMRMTDKNGFFMDYVAVKGVLSNKIVYKENVNIIESLDFRYGTSRELFLVTTNFSSKDDVSETFRINSDLYEILDHVKVDDRLFEEIRDGENL